MINEGGVVQMLAPRRQIQSVESAFGSLGVEGYADLVSRQSSAQREGVRDKSAVLLLLDLGERDVRGLFAFALELVVLDAGALPEDDLGDRVGQVLALAEVRFHHLRGAVLGRDDQNSGSREGRFVRVREKRQI